MYVYVYVYKGGIMKKIITLANRRGGAGKTATAHAIGAGLKRMGNRVLFIDLDSQCNLTYDMGVMGNSKGTMELLEGTAGVDEILITTLAQGDILPGTPNLSRADLTITQKGKEYRLKEAIEPLKKKYDYIIIDTPPALGITSINAFTASTDVIIPAQAEVHSIQGIILLNSVIETVKKYTNPTLQVTGILLTRYTRRAILSQKMAQDLEILAHQMNTRLFKTPIRECIAVKEAQACQRDIFNYARNSNAGKDYTALIKELLDTLEYKNGTQGKEI